jgi:hypothetical protein
MQVVIDDAAVRRMLDKLEDGEAAKAGLRAMAEHLYGKMRPYAGTNFPRPLRAQIYGTAFQSEKQRRYFFAALRDGRISVPYKRTMHLRDMWGRSVEDGGWTQVVGNNADYAPYVIGATSQSLYMKSLGWSSTAAVVEREADAAFKTFVAGFRQSMQAR